MNPAITAKVIEIAKKEGVEPLLLAAIVMQESACNVYAVRFEPAWRLYKDPEKYAKQNGITLETEKFNQGQSFGLCQVMGCVMRERGFEGPWGLAFDSTVNLTIGARHLKAFLTKYKDEQDAIASYNAGNPRKLLNPGKPGEYAYSNQNYVDSVLKHKEKLKQIFTGAVNV